MLSMHYHASSNRLPIRIPARPKMIIACRSTILTQNVGLDGNAS